MTRIIAGRGKGRRLKTPDGTRRRGPRAARVKQTLFDILAPRLRRLPLSRRLRGRRGHRPRGPLARGRRRWCSWTRARAAVAAIKENLRALSALGGEAQVFRQDARVALPALADAGHRFDVVYLDPPYASDLYEPLLEPRRPTCSRRDGLVVAEHFHKRVLPETIGRLARRPGGPGGRPSTHLLPSPDEAPGPAGRQE